MLLNFKILSSVIHYLLRDFVAIITEKYKIADDPEDWDHFE